VVFLCALPTSKQCLSAAHHTIAASLELEAGVTGTIEALAAFDTSVRSTILVGAVLDTSALSHLGLDHMILLLLRMSGYRVEENSCLKTRHFISSYLSTCDANG
jgi:hypothetical protein